MTALRTQRHDDLRSTQEPGCVAHILPKLNTKLCYSIPEGICVYEVEDRAIEPDIHYHVQIIVAKRAQVKLILKPCQRHLFCHKTIILCYSDLPDHGKHRWYSLWFGTAECLCTTSSPAINIPVSLATIGAATASTVDVYADDKSWFVGRPAVLASF
jgi:hypothetical protein